MDEKLTVEDFTYLVKCLVLNYNKDQHDTYYYDEKLICKLLLSTDVDKKSIIKTIKYFNGE